jgi:hypothetical protein
MKATEGIYDSGEDAYNQSSASLEKGADVFPGFEIMAQFTVLSIITGLNKPTRLLAHPRRVRN